MVDEIRRAYGQPGEVKEVGRGFEWQYGYPQYGSAYVYGHVSVAPRRGRTRIRATRRLSNQTLVFLLPFFPALLAVLLGIGAIAGKTIFWVPILLALVTAASFMWARSLFGSMSRKAEADLDEMMARLETIAGESEQYAEEETAAMENEGGRLDAGLLDDNAPTSASSNRTRRRTR